MRDPAHRFAAHCRLMLTRKRSVRRPACTDVPDQQISAGFRTASRHPNFGHLARGITPLRDGAGDGSPCRSPPSHPLKCPKRLRTNRSGTSRPNCVRGSPANHRSQLHINTQIRLRCRGFKCRCSSGWQIDISLFMEYRSLLIPC